VTPLTRRARLEGAARVPLADAGCARRAARGVASRERAPLCGARRGGARGLWRCCTGMEYALAVMRRKTRQRLGLALIVTLLRGGAPGATR